MYYEIGKGHLSVKTQKLKSFFKYQCNDTETVAVNETRRRRRAAGDIARSVSVTTMFKVGTQGTFKKKECTLNAHIFLTFSFLSSRHLCLQHCHHLNF